MQCHQKKHWPFKIFLPQAELSFQWSAQWITNFLEVNELPLVSLPENEGWITAEENNNNNKNNDCGFSVHAAGKALSVQAHNHFLSGHLKQLIVKCIGTAAAGSLCRALKISRAWWCFYYHRRKSPMVQHEWRPQKIFLSIWGMELLNGLV